MKATVTKERCEQIRNFWIKKAATMILFGKKQKIINFNSTIKQSPITGLIDFEKRLVQFDSPIESIISIWGVAYSSSVTGVQSIQDPTIQDLTTKKAANKKSAMAKSAHKAGVR